MQEAAAPDRFSAPEALVPQPPPPTVAAATVLPVPVAVRGFPWFGSLCLADKNRATKTPKKHFFVSDLKLISFD